jgi:hypothetical protein
MKCKHCEFLNTVFREIQNNREYWIYTEMFVYLHGGADHCQSQAIKDLQDIAEEWNGIVRDLRSTLSFGGKDGSK